MDYFPTGIGFCCVPEGSSNIRMVQVRALSLEGLPVSLLLRLVFVA